VAVPLAVAALAAVWALCPAFAEQVPRDTLTWGFCQVGGTGRGAEWPLSRDQLILLRDELHSNTLRFFVHPGFVGLQQKTWNGPESVNYARAEAGDYLWRDPSPAIDSLDEVVDLLRELRLHPVLLPLPVDEYVAWIGRDDLTFLNDVAKGLDYTGIRPAEQVQAFTVAIARHLHEVYGDEFTLIFAEVAGQGEGAPRRLQDRARWAEVCAAVKAVAPGVAVCSPELCVSMWWWGVAQPASLKPQTAPRFLPAEIPYGDRWPRGDRLENYRDTFDLPAISYYGFGPESVEWQDVASNRPALAAATEAVLWVTRPAMRPKRWLWAEAGWGAPVKERPPSHLERDLAALLFGMDHCAGALLWQARNHQGSGGGVFTEKGDRDKSYALLKAVADVVLANAAFFAADHERLNADGFPVDEDLFAEGDPAVLSRFVGRHLLLFSEAAVETSVTFARTGGRRLREVEAGHGYSRPWPLTVTANPDGGITVSHLRPGVLYVLQVLP
jgi:hypothetical protein